MPGTATVMLRGLTRARGRSWEIVSASRDGDTLGCRPWTRSTSRSGSIQSTCGARIGVLANRPPLGTRSLQRRSLTIPKTPLTFNNSKTLASFPDSNEGRGAQRAEPKPGRDDGEHGPGLQGTWGSQTLRV